jgi:hypothetical protein
MERGKHQGIKLQINECEGDVLRSVRFSFYSLYVGITAVRSYVGPLFFLLLLLLPCFFFSLYVLFPFHALELG